MASEEWTRGAEAMRQAVHRMVCDMAFEREDRFRKGDSPDGFMQAVSLAVAANNIRVLPVPDAPTDSEGE